MYPAAPGIASFPGIAGEALNRCEVRVLQRKDLERRLKEQRRSLVDSRLWLGANRMCLGWKRIA